MTSLKRSHSVIRHNTDPVSRLTFKTAKKEGLKVNLAWPLDGGQLLGLFKQVSPQQVTRSVPKVDNAIHWENIYAMKSIIGFFNSLDSYLFGE